MKGCRLIQDFVLPSLWNRTFGDLLKWDPTDASVFMLRWIHKARSSWTECDAAVFLAWDVLKGRAKPKTPADFVNSKQRLRAALRNVKTVEEVRASKGYRRYRILGIEGTNKGSMMKPIKYIKYQHEVIRDSKVEENSRHIRMAKVDLCDEKKSIEIKKEVKDEEKEKYDDFLNQSKIYTFRNLRTKKRVVYCEEDSNFSEDFSKIENENVQTTMVPIEMTIKKDSQAVLTKTNKIKSEMNMNWQIEKSCRRKAKEDMCSPINKKSNRYRINNLENLDIVNIEKPFMSSVPSSKLKPNLPVMLQEKKITPTPEVLVHEIMKSNDLLQNESKIMQTLSQLQVFDKDVSIMDVENHTKTKINQCKSMNTKKMNHVQQNQGEENIGGEAATKQINRYKTATKQINGDKTATKENIGGVSASKDNIRQESVTKEKIGARTVVKENSGRKAATKANTDAAVKEKNRWDYIDEKWSDYKWDPSKEPLPHFFNPEIELTDLLEYLNDYYLQSIMLKKLDRFYVPPKPASFATSSKKI